MADQHFPSAPEAVNMADQHFLIAPEAVNLEVPPEHGAGPEALHPPEPEPGSNQEELGRNNDLETSKGKIWGMKHKTFTIVLGIIAILIIAVAAGVGWGVGVAAAKSKRQGSPSSS